MEFRPSLLHCRGRGAALAGRPAPPDQPAAAQPADPRPGAATRGQVLIRGRSIELTEAGWVLLEHGRSASEAVTYAVQAAREAGEGMTRLRVGYPAGLPRRRCRWPSDLPRAVPSSRPRYGGRAGRRAPCGRCRPSARRGLRAPCRRQRRQLAWPLHREPVHVAIPELHPLARLRAVRAGHLANEPIVLFPRALDPPLHDHLVHDVLAGCGVAPSVVLGRPRWRAAWSRSPAGWGSLSRPSRRPDSSPSAGSSHPGHGGPAAAVRRELAA